MEHDSAYFRNEFYGGGAKKRGEKPLQSTKAKAGSKVFQEDLPREMLFKSSKVTDPYANFTDTESIKHRTQANFFKRQSVENSENNLLMPATHFEADMGSDRPKRTIKKKKKKRGSKKDERQIEKLQREVEQALKMEPVQ